MEKMVLTVVLVLLLAALMVCPVMAEGRGFESLPRLSVTSTGRISVSYDLTDGGPAAVHWTTNLDVEELVFENVYGTGISEKHHTYEFPELGRDAEVAYKVVSGSLVSDVYYFHNLPRLGDDTKIAVYGQTGDNGEVHEYLAPFILHERPDIVIQGGGIVADADTIRFWKDFWNAAKDLMGSTPYLCAKGGKDGGTLWDTYWEFPRPGNYFSVESGIAKIIVMDATEDFTAGSRQNDWLLGELYSSLDKEWLIVVLNSAPFSGGPNGSSYEAQLYLVPLFEAYGVDLVISSSDNSYQRLVHNGVNYVVTGGGGAPLTSAGRLPETQITDSYYHYVLLDMNRERLRLLAIRTNATVIEEFQLTSMDVPEKPEKMAVEIGASPNPFNANCDIEVSMPSNCSEWDFYLTDMQGRKIDRGWKVNNAGDNSLSIHWDAEGLPTGVYMANLRTESGVTSKRIVLAK